MNAAQQAELKAWLKTRPRSIQDAYKAKPADKTYRLANVTDRTDLARILAYREPSDNKTEVTVRCEVHALEWPPGPLNPRQVFGIALSNLIEVTEAEADEMERRKWKADA